MSLLSNSKNNVTPVVKPRFSGDFSPRKRQIFDVAAQLFARNGYQGTSNYMMLRWMQPVNLLPLRLHKQAARGSGWKRHVVRCWRYSSIRTRSRCH